MEHVSFRLADGVAEDRFLQLDRAVQVEWAPFQAGFIRRTTARGADGRWLIETLWYDEEHCAAALVRGDGPAADLLRCMDASSVESARWETLE